MQIYTYIYTHIYIYLCIYLFICHLEHVRIYIYILWHRRNNVAHHGCSKSTCPAEYILLLLPLVNSCISAITRLPDLFATSGLIAWLRSRWATVRFRKCCGKHRPAFSAAEARVGSETARDFLHVVPDVRVPFAEDLRGLDHRVCYSLGVILLKLGDRRRSCSTTVAEHGNDTTAVLFLPPKIGEIPDHS